MKNSKKFSELEEGDFLYKLYKNPLGDLKIIQCKINKITRRIKEDDMQEMLMDLSLYFPGLGIKYEEFVVDQSCYEDTHDKQMFTDIYTAHKNMK